MKECEAEGGFLTEPLKTPGAPGAGVWPCGETVAK